VKEEPYLCGETVFVLALPRYELKVWFTVLAPKTLCLLLHTLLDFCPDQFAQDKV
jgi:hypothetical protein